MDGNVGNFNGKCRRIIDSDDSDLVTVQNMISSFSTINLVFRNHCTYALTVAARDTLQADDTAASRCQDL
jgi:hypothetical protein